MSREIKFRAWVEESNWDYYAYNIQERADMAEWFGNQNIHIEQYTGLRDKNGKEIYEDDIVQIPGERALIVFDETKGSFMGRFFIDHKGKKIESNDYVFAFCPDDIEVIGNIHENPELAGGEE